MSAVENYIDRMSISPLIHHITADRTETVQVILYDGRVIVVRFPPSPFPYSFTDSELTVQGKLRGSDIRTNLILSDCVEREFSEDQGVEMTPLGLYMIKGDNV